MNQKIGFIYLFIFLLSNCTNSDISTIPTTTDSVQKIEPPYGHISFASQFDGISCSNTWEIHLIEADKNSESIQITNNMNTYNSDLSSDGTRIVFDSEVDGDGEIYVVNTDSKGEIIKLTDNEYIDAAPAWSPDGTQIVFLRAANIDELDSEGYEIMTVNILTGEEKSLTRGFAPSWSPDGSRIVFGRDGEIYIFDLTNLKTINLTNSPRISEIGPKFSPDGRQIIFESEYNGNPEIFTMNVDGSGEINLTNHPGNDFNADYSPDGQYIVFNSWRNEPALKGRGAYLYIMDRYGQEQKVITNHGCEVRPSWSK